MFGPNTACLSVDVGCWMFDVRCWLSAIGYRLLAIGYWLLAIGYRLLSIGVHAPPYCYGGRVCIVEDRGRDGGLNVTPPSEPDGRISRIRLSSQWLLCETSHKHMSRVPD